MKTEPIRYVRPMGLRRPKPVAKPESKEIILVLPFWSGDVALACKNIEWMAELDSALPYDCILACDTDTDPKPVKDLADLLFKSVRMIRYARATHNGEVMTKWPWQQNNAFYNTAIQIEKYRRPWFWFETDCTPLCSGWLDVMSNEFKRGGKPFGGHWNPYHQIFNGVGIYPYNVVKYAPEALMVALRVYADNSQNPWDAHASKDIYPHLHIMNNVMQHLWCLPNDPDKAPTFPTIESVRKWIRPDVVQFHRCKDGTLIDRMREMKQAGLSLKCIGKDVVDPALTKINQTVDMLIVTYRKDIEWFKVLVKSIQKFVSGFNRIVVVVPRQDGQMFKDVVRSCPEFDVKVFDEQPGKGMVHHEAIVCTADAFCDADYICHVDSDCMFIGPTTPEDYFNNGKPVMLKVAFSSLSGPVMNWQTAVEKALGFKPEYETMQRHPAVHPRWIYPRVRAAVETHTGRKFLDYVLSCENSFPQGFAEFPTLGAWALKYAPDVHYWVDITGKPHPPSNLLQFWSHGGLDRPIDNYSQTPSSFQNQTPRNVIKTVLG